MKTINDLKLSKKAKAVVRTWLDEWLDMFIAQANGRQGTVHRADFANDDFFYFTDCTDVLSKDPEAKGQEESRSIIKRKQKVMLQLLIKTLLGTVECKKIKCSHCGYPDRYIGPLSNGTGHFLYCPKCQYTNICTYPSGYKTCVDDVKYKSLPLRNKFLETEIPATNCGACCKGIPDKLKHCGSCKFQFYGNMREPCMSCVEVSNWKSKECVCQDH